MDLHHYHDGHPLHGDPELDTVEKFVATSMEFHARNVFDDGGKSDPSGSGGHDSGCLLADPFLRNGLLSFWKT